MKNLKLLPVIFLCWCCVISMQTFAQAPILISATPNNTTIARLDKFEVVVALTAGYTNPYDYDDISVKGIFTSPVGQKYTVDGFFMQDFTADASGNLTSIGTGAFKVRFAPNEVGQWSYSISCTNRLGSATLSLQNFSCQTSASFGFIRKNSSNYLSYDNGSQYIALGEDMGWQTNAPIVDYTTWGTKLADNGGNFIRVWMADFGFGLEWKNGSNGFGGLKNYKQSNAFNLDWLFDFCSKKGIYIMLDLIQHGTVSTTVNPEWQDSPYNSTNWGPCKNTWDFFTNDTARAFVKNRFRYIVARYGYSKNLQSWEIFNEVDWTDSFAVKKPLVTTWHNEMANYLRGIDVNKHLISTSYALDYNDSATWNLPSIDFTQTHYYSRVPNIEKILVAGVQDYLTNYKKPTLNGEFGLEVTAGQAEAVEDSTGIHLHNAIWATVFGGAFGTGMTWYWDSYIEPRNLYPQYKPLAAVVSTIKFKEDNYKPAIAYTVGGGGVDLVIAAGYQNFGKSPAGDFIIDQSGSMTPGSASLGQTLFGNSSNTQYRNPPTFHINYPVAAQFKVTTGNTTGQTPIINIYVDGVAVLAQFPVLVATTYSVNVPAGQHDIKVDNLGTDWVSIASFTFTNIGSPINNYVLKSADQTKAVGYVLNSNYNWNYFLTSAGASPTPISGSKMLIPGMVNNNYKVQFINTHTAAIIKDTTIAVSNNILTIPFPTVNWDYAFTAAPALYTLPIVMRSLTGEVINEANQLYIDIVNSEKVKTISVQRAGADLNFLKIKNVSDTWAAIDGKHTFIDVKPIEGINFYRLAIEDEEGRITYSSIVKLYNFYSSFSIFPNPFDKEILLKVKAGNFVIKVADQAGKVLLVKKINSSYQQNINLNMNKIIAGIYYLSVYNIAGELLGQQKMVKSK